MTSVGTIEDALMKRLQLKEGKLVSAVAGIRQIARTDEPLGKCLYKMQIMKGLVLEKITVPIGVLLIIFEVRVLLLRASQSAGVNDRHVQRHCCKLQLWQSEVETACCSKEAKKPLNQIYSCTKSSPTPSTPFSPQFYPPPPFLF